MKTLQVLITGTHHTPAIELIHQLRVDKIIHWRIDYIGHLFPSETHLSQTLIPKLKINFHPLSCGKLDRRWLPNTILGIPKTITAIFLAYRLIKKIRPDIVVSFGGYVSVPVVISAKICRIPSLTHEQTLTNSLSTKINSYFVNRIALSFNNPAQISRLPKNKVVITGNLLRSEIYQKTTVNFKNLETKNLPLIYVTGGNQGSSAINQIILKILLKINKKFIIVHHTGNLDYQSIIQNTKNIPNYYPTDYIGLDDIGWVLNQAQIIISRSGANTCQEIVALGKNSILIPLIKSQQNEQLLNARWVKQQQPLNTIIIPQNILTVAKLLHSIRRLSVVKPLTPSSPASSNLKLLNLIHEMV